MEQFLERHADKGWQSLEAFRGLRRDRVVTHSKIRRPEAKEYYGGHETPEGYAEPARTAFTSSESSSNKSSTR